MERPVYRIDREREYLARGWWRDDDTLPHWLARHVKERPEAPALVSSQGCLTWKALGERVFKVAQGLKKRGIARGDVVAVQLANVPEFVVAYLAICRLGALMCTLHMPYRGAEIEAILAHSGAKLFINAAFPFQELEEEPLEKSHPLPDSRDPFLLLYTSGTTASPKAAPHPCRTMLGNGRLGAKEHGIDEQSRVMSAAPLSHLYGLYSLHCAWAVGACTVLLPAFKPDELSLFVEKYRPTALWTAPAHVAACRAAGLFDRHDWSSLRMAIVSGSMAPPELVEFFAEKTRPHCAVTQLWGMTELQAALYSRPGDALEVSATSAGRPSPGTQIRISEENELQVRGPLMFSGYYRNEEANRGAFTGDGWFRSGDLAEMRAGGNVAITGRTRDIINRGGVKFNPADVEGLLDAHPKVLQSAIVPMPDAVLGEKACAFVTLKPGCAAPSLDELAQYLLDKRIAKNKLPEKLVVIPEMPLTPTRKIIKSKLRP